MVYLPQCAPTDGRGVLDNIQRNGAGSTAHGGWDGGGGGAQSNDVRMVELCENGALCVDMYRLMQAQDLTLLVLFQRQMRPRRLVFHQLDAPKATYPNGLQNLQLVERGVLGVEFGLLEQYHRTAPGVQDRSTHLREQSSHGLLRFTQQRHHPCRRAGLMLFGDVLALLRPCNASNVRPESIRTERSNRDKGDTGQLARHTHDTRKRVYRVLALCRPQPTSNLGAPLLRGGVGI